jgi:hypothetical protein
VVGEHDYFEQAADALSRAFQATRLGEQAMLLDEALRLNRVGLMRERARLARLAVDARLARLEAELAAELRRASER